MLAGDLDDVATVERRLLGGEARRAELVADHLLDERRGVEDHGRLGGHAADSVEHVGGVDLERGEFAYPAFVDGCSFGDVGLRCAGVDRGSVRGLRAGMAGQFELLSDLLGSLAEGVSDAAIHAGDLRVGAVGIVRPFHADPAGQLTAERGLVEVAGGLRFAVQQCAV